MPRNASGIYSLPAAAGNPVVSATTIEPDWANQTLNDIATAITGSLPRDGSAPMTGALTLAGNAVAALAAVPKQQLDAAIVAVTATSLANTPAGNIAATNIQAAINELDTEKEVAGTAASAVAAHTSDATDAHAASAITNTPAGNIAAVTVQAALNELDSEKQTAAQVTSAIATAEAATTGWQDVTASRSLITSYPNSTGKEIKVSVFQTSAAGGNNYFRGLVGGVVVAVGSSSGSAGSAIGLFFTVPAGSSYSVTVNGTSTVGSWFEES